MRKLKTGNIIVIFFAILLNFALAWMLSLFDHGQVFFMLYLLVYAIYAGVVLSSNADSVLDLFMRTRKPTAKEKARVEAIIAELRDMASEHGQLFMSDLRVRMITNLYPNAIAYGHKSIALTTGLLEGCEYPEVRAVVAHEIAHHVNGDTHEANMVYAAFGVLLPLGSFLIPLTVSFLELGIAGVAMVLGILFVCFPVFFALLLFFVWVSIRQFKMQKMEYAADAYAVRVTQDNGLIDFLDQIEHLDTTPNGVLAMHMRGHPPTALRKDEAEHILENL